MYMFNNFSLFLNNILDFCKNSGKDTIDKRQMKMKKGERVKDESINFPRKTQWYIIQKHIYLGWSYHESLCFSRKEVG